jgi:hypothetical protein
MSADDYRVVHFFHWPGYSDHQKTLVQAISLPIGARGWFHYGRIWPNESLLSEKENINGNKECIGLLWVLSCKPKRVGDSQELEFDYATPIRVLKKIKITEDSENVFINYIADRYFSRIQRYDLETLKEYINIVLDGINKPYPCSQNGYVYISNSPINIDLRDDISSAEMFAVLADIPSGKNEPEIKDYPLIKIEQIRKSKLNEEGEFIVDIDRVYKVPYSVYQPDKHRSRKILVNHRQKLGKLIKGKIAQRITEEQESINIEVSFSNLEILVPIYLKLRKVWYKRKWVPIAVIFILALLAYWFFLRIAPAPTMTERLGLISALAVMFIGKVFESLTR